MDARRAVRVHEPIANVAGAVSGEAAGLQNLGTILISKEKEKTYLPLSRPVGPLMVRLRFAVAVAGGVCESLTCTVKLWVPWLVGVPVMAPEELRVRPAGKLPEVIDQVYGGTPPEAASEPLYGTPIDPAVSEEVVIDRGELTLMVSEAMSTAAVGVWESVTEILKVVELTVVGVPLMMPPVLMVRPVGNVPDASAQVKGPLPPVELSMVEYGTLITAAGSAVEVMTSGAFEFGGLPLPQERANPHRNKQGEKERSSTRSSMSS